MGQLVYFGPTQHLSRSQVLDVDVDDLLSELGGSSPLPLAAPASSQKRRRSEGDGAVDPARPRKGPRARLQHDARAPTSSPPPPQLLQTLITDGGADADKSDPSPPPSPLAPLTEPFDVVRPASQPDTTGHNRASIVL